MLFIPLAKSVGLIKSCWCPPTIAPIRKQREENQSRKTLTGSQLEDAGEDERRTQIRTCKGRWFVLPSLRTVALCTTAANNGVSHQ
eukprot:272682-Rhodomonas_salina.4